MLMLVSLKEWELSQGVLLLLSTFALLLDNVLEYMLPSGREFSEGRCVAVTVSEPAGSFGWRLARVSLRRTVGAQVWRQARSTLPTTRSSFRSRSLG